MNDTDFMREAWVNRRALWIEADSFGETNTLQAIREARAELAEILRLGEVPPRLRPIPRPGTPEETDGFKVVRMAERLLLEHDEWSFNACRLRALQAVRGVKP